MPTTKQRKIALMGYRSVGKSSLSLQFVEGKFLEDYDPTIENTFKKTLRINSVDYDLILVDTIGQDGYSMFPLQYSLDVHGYVLVYSIDNAKSFEVVAALYEKLLDITGKNYFPSVLVGNKSDLSYAREVSSEEGKKLAEKWKATFLETSAKQNIAVTKVFHALLNDIERADGNDDKVNLLKSWIDFQQSKAKRKRDNMFEFKELVIREENLTYEARLKIKDGDLSIYPVDKGIPITTLTEDYINGLYDVAENSITINRMQRGNRPRPPAIQITFPNEDSKKRAAKLLRKLIRDESEDSAVSESGSD